MADGWVNRLYLGNNLGVLRRELPGASVDLAYMDPPFNTKNTYRVRRRRATTPDGPGRPGDWGGPAQATAFVDSWQWGPEAEAAWSELLNSAAARVRSLAQAIPDLLGTSGTAAYLSMIAVRLLEIHRVLKDSGAIYLHCDPTASHHLRLVMDAVFSPRNFQNEIIWSYRSGGGSSRRFGRKHDVLLYYTKGPNFTFNADAVRVPYDAAIAAKRRHLFDPRGKVPGDVWDVSRPPNHSKEWVGYPTQKPEALLRRVVLTSSNPGDVVLDAFCGSGTALVVAESLDRRWVGIDCARAAVSLASRRLQDRFGLTLRPFRLYA